MDNEQKHTTEKPDDMIKELKDKIKSKMDVSKIFAGFITLFIGITFKDGDISSDLPKFGVLFIVASLILCVLSIFAYDHMLWPKGYWYDYQKKDPLVEKAYQERLMNEMLRSWRSLFFPGVICFSIGIFLILFERIGLIALFTHEGLGKWQNWILAAFFLVIIMLPILFWNRFWPDFGDSILEKKNVNK
jgi:hypothetical protein